MKAAEQKGRDYMTKKISLYGTWTLKRISTADRYPMKIPGDIFSALIEENVIDDPYLGCNEKEFRHLADETWEIERTIVLDKDSVSNKHLYLEIESIDTVADIFCNQVKVKTADNMFTALRVPLDDVAIEGQNTISILFHSAQRCALERSRALGYPVEHSIYPVQSMHRNLVRKAQCHSGWDWGPCLMTAGIYGEISILSTPFELIDSVHTDIKRTGNSWEVEVHTRTVSPAEGTSAIHISIKDTQIRDTLTLKEGLNESVHTIRMDDVKLWWPRGYGEQTLYRLTVTTDNDRKEKEIGFREIVVDTTPDAKGIPMTFIVNGIPVFAKGANWIPMDALPSRYSDERYEDLLTSAASAHMNMIRVWGGGHYEQEIFYRLCDRLGLLVWQDFMFACSLYPSQSWFLDSVAQEVEYQVIRLKDHPSIALWCGNNEDVGALTWFDSSRENRDRYIIDYDRLNEGVVGRIVKDLDPNRKWWSSSPSAGEGDYSDCWHDDTKGDMHYWSVWHEGKDIEAYKDVTPRFCSEFGFQSFPSYPLLESVITHNGTREASSGDFNLSGEIMEHHQRNERGNTIILSTMLKYFHLPSTFKDQLYVSQVQQAFAVQTAIEFWRSSRPVCMGTLYWQLNDNWPVASWSSIEYGGKWKALHYAASHFYAPFILTFQKKDDTIHLLAVNDSLKKIRGKLTIDRIFYKGDTDTIITMNDVTVGSQESAELYRLEPDETDRRKSYLIRAVFESDEGERTENFYFPTSYKKADLQPSRLDINFIKKGKKVTAIELSSNRAALFCSIDLRERRLQLSDNFFHLMPDETKTIRILNGELSEEETEHLEIRHLRETY